MSDNFYDTEFGPSTPGALNLVSGQTGGATPLNAAGQVVNPASGVGSQNASGVGTVVGDPDPFYGGCANHSNPTAPPSPTTARTTTRSSTTSQRPTRTTPLRPA